MRSCLVDSETLKMSELKHWCEYGEVRTCRLHHLQFIIIINILSNSTNNHVYQTYIYAYRTKTRHWQNVDFSGSKNAWFLTPHQYNDQKLLVSYAKINPIAAVPTKNSEQYDIYYGDDYWNDIYFYLHRIMNFQTVVEHPLAVYTIE